VPSIALTFNMNGKTATLQMTNAHH